MKQNKSTNIIWVIFTIIGTLFFILGTSIVISNYKDRENRIYTIGTITEITSYKDSDGDIKHNTYVSYNIDGKQYESDLNGYSSSFYKGKEIEIYYNKNNPNIIGTEIFDFLTFIFPTLGLIVIIIGINGLVSKVRKKRIVKILKENGQLIYADYVETVCNTSYSLNDRHPYNINCEWTNTLNGKKYLFKSDNIWFNPEKIIREKNIKTFPIYIDMNSMKNYYMDLEELESNVVDLR